MENCWLKQDTAIYAAVEIKTNKTDQHINKRNLVEFIYFQTCGRH
jgi:hypothetical protein